MQINRKDRLFILFIATVLILLWAAYLLISYLFYSNTYHKSAAADLISDKNLTWFNTAYNPEEKDLKNRIIVVNFSNHSSSNSIYLGLELQNIANQFSNRISIIGVHNPIFASDKDGELLKNTITKYGLHYPIVNDADLKITKKFKISRVPSLLLIDNRGKIFGTYDEYQTQQIKKDIEKLLGRYFIQTSKNPLMIAAPNKNNLHILTFPTKIAFAEKLRFGNFSGSAIIIANSSANNIIISSLSGRLIATIGSGRRGFADGSFDKAAFNLPRGILFADNKLYIADSANNALRLVDFEKSEVSTIIGSGKIGTAITQKQNIKEVNLAMPWDLDFFPDDDNIAISNSATNQILRYDILKGTIQPLVSDLNQPSGLTTYDDKLYFTDSNSGSVKVIDKSGTIIRSLSGDGLQYPLDITIYDKSIYITDGLNHVIKKYDSSDKKFVKIFGANKMGNNVSSANDTQFNEPQGIISIKNRFYIVDSNNHRIIVTDSKKKKAEILDILPPQLLSKDRILKYLPNLHKLNTIKVAQNQVITLKINLPEGFKINEQAPSFINLLQPLNDEEANLISIFDWNMIASKELRLPHLKDDYILQGTIYYCEDKQNALCYIDSIEQKIEAVKSSKTDSININLEK